MLAPGFGPVGTVAEACGPPERIDNSRLDFYRARFFYESPESHGFLADRVRQVKRFECGNAPFGCAEAIYYQIATGPQHFGDCGAADFGLWIR